MSWHQHDPVLSRRLIEGVTTPSSAVVDVGGGASRLVDALLAAGYRDLTVVDVAAPALAQARNRLGRLAEDVTWVTADVRDLDLHRQFDLWHDRAVLHFLTAPVDRDRYREAVRRHVRPLGHVVLATFGPQGPTTCSGLPVRRYDRDALATALGADFRPLDVVEELHTTPAGTPQQFLYCLLQRVAADGGAREASAS